MQPLACDLGALEPAERARYAALRADLGARRLGVRDAADGYLFTYPADAQTILELAEFVTLERRCCPFFDFTLQVAAEVGEVRLTIGGGPEVKEFLRGQAV